MLKVGLTGGIGSGKSIITTVFSQLGVPIFNSDIEAKKCMGTDITMKKKIYDLLGKESYKNGKLQTSFVADKIFNHPSLKKKIHDIVHPAVEEAYNKWLKSVKYSYTIKEAAILIEMGSYKKLDKIILVTAPVSLRIKRVMERDRDKKIETIQAIIKNQFSDSQKMEMADFIIKNDEKKMVLPQIFNIHNTILSSI